MKKLVVLLTFGILGIFISFYFTKKPLPNKSACGGNTQTIQIKDAQHMAGLLESGKSYEVEMGYYDCHPPKRGDLVLYRFSQGMDPVVKVVRATGGDRFELVEDMVHGAWNLRVNGELVKDLADRPYYFGGNNRPTLGLYEKERNNILGPEEAIVFSTVSPGKEDSGSFGLTHRRDFLGKLKL